MPNSLRPVTVGRVRRASILVLVLVVAGCGGGGGGKRLSRIEYASKADVICRKANEQTKSLKQPSNLAELAKGFDNALPIFEHAIANLRKLKPPKGEQVTVDRWLAKSDALKRDLEQIRDRAKAKDLKGVQSLFKKATRDQQSGNQLAGTLGMKVCNKG
jgi:hypothetical protein